jgi:hypothetical protein
MLSPRILAPSGALPTAFDTNGKPPSLQKRLQGEALVSLAHTGLRGSYVSSTRPKPSASTRTPGALTRYEAAQTHHVVPATRVRGPKRTHTSHAHSTCVDVRAGEQSPAALRERARKLCPTVQASAMSHAHAHTHTLGPLHTRTHPGAPCGAGTAPSACGPPAARSTRWSSWGQCARRPPCGPRP